MIYLETKRLILRTWRDQDLPAFAVMNQDPEVMHFFPMLWPTASSHTFIERMNEDFMKKGFCFFACELKSEATLIGFVGLNTPTFKAHFTPCTEIGWRLKKEYWNQGYATEAAAAIMAVAAEKHGLSEIVAFAVKDNLPSRRVMEKIGMQYQQADDFQHPELPLEHPLSLHVLYKKSI